MKTYQKITINMVNGSWSFRGTLSTQSEENLIHIFDNGILIATVNTNNVIWIEYEA